MYPYPKDGSKVIDGSAVQVNSAHRSEAVVQDKNGPKNYFIAIAGD
ncbi:MAG TPA: hypothetical protein VM935_17805 [Chitinophagaceae bacterium]|nr:hypothetical protein [Chitinophagaceae bacterium]